MELTFLTVAHMVLCFTFMAKAVPVTPAFWLLLGSACSALRFSLLSPGVHTRLGAEAARTADPK